MVSCREKVELAEDIQAKQDLIQQRRVELEGIQENVDHATQQRESLEHEREEARTVLEQLNTEVSGDTMYLVMFTHWEILDFRKRSLKVR